MTTYDFMSQSLDGLDSLQTDIVVLPYFADERPLRGAAGLADWRLCGALSRKLMAGYLDGSFGAKALLVSPGKIKTDGLLLLGLGSSREFDMQTARRACVMIVETLAAAALSTAALALPGRSMDQIAPLDAMQLWLAASQTPSQIEEIIIIERSEDHRPLESLLDGLRRQAESPLS